MLLSVLKKEKVELVYEEYYKTNFNKEEPYKEKLPQTNCDNTINVPTSVSSSST